MKTERWQQISQLYDVALSLGGSERAEFLRHACAGDSALQREVESLLAQEGGVENFLKHPPQTPGRRTMQRSASVTLALCALILQPRPTLAQSSPGFELARTSFTSVHEYVAAEAIPRQLSPPPNLVISDAYRQLVESMLRDSPTFRRQCVRIAGEPLLTVYVNIQPPPWPSGIRAATHVSRQPNGRLSAHIAIAPLNDVIELLAHEFEHVIEHLDGVDLAALAALPRTGVHQQDEMHAAFETVRATYIGRKVTAELGRK